MRQASRNSCSVTTLCSTILSSTAEHRTVKNHFGCFGYTCLKVLRLFLQRSGPLFLLEMAEKIKTVIHYGHHTLPTFEGQN